MDGPFPDEVVVVVVVVVVALDFVVPCEAATGGGLTVGVDTPLDGPDPGAC